MRLSNLGIALRLRYKRTHMPIDLDTAIEVSRDAAAAFSKERVERCGLLANLCLALRDRYERTQVPADLDAAITAVRDSAFRRCDQTLPQPRPGHGLPWPALALRPTLTERDR